MYKIKAIAMSLAFFALTAALALATTFTISCGKWGGDVKLLETITDESGKVQRFEYDKQNRIVKIGDKTITYADNLITVGTQKYAINGKTITEDDKPFTINGDGYIVNESYGNIDYEYKDGNLIRVFWGESAYEDNYSYDDKKSPFSNCTTPKWLLQRLSGIYSTGASKNNVVSYEGENGKGTYKYEYDSDGFPLKLTRTYKPWEGDEVYTTITNYTYYGSK